MLAAKLEPEKYRLGHTKVFFRAGILGYMEEVREDKIASVLALLQAQARGKAGRTMFSKLKERKLALYCLQRTIRNYWIGKTWKWWQLWLAIKPNLKCTKFAQYKAEYEEKIKIAEANIDKAVAECNQVTKEHEKLMADKEELVRAMESGGSAIQEIVDKTNAIEGQKNQLQKQVDALNSSIRAEEDAKAALLSQSSKAKDEVSRMKQEIEELQVAFENCEEDKVSKDSQIQTLKEELAHQEDMIAKLNREKRGVG